jgi:hypothetical protein
MNQELLREFASQSPEAISWAFRQWRAGSPYLPAICDLWGLINRYHEKRAVEIAEDEQAAEKQDAARRLAAGEKQLKAMTKEEISHMILSVLKPMDNRVNPLKTDAATGRTYVAPAPDQLRDRLISEKARLEKWLVDHPKIAKRASKKK